MSDFQSVLNILCRDLPDGYCIKIHCENGYGGVTLHGPKLLVIDGDNPDTSLEEQALDLVRIAKEHEEQQ